MMRKHCRISSLDRRLKRSALEGTAVADSPAYFRFTDTDGKPRFFIELRDPDKIAHARRILSGEERSRIHVQGTVVKRVHLD
jgi:hypothetical protein